MNRNLCIIEVYARLISDVEIDTLFCIFCFKPYNMQNN